MTDSAVILVMLIMMFIASIFLRKLHERFQTATNSRRIIYSTNKMNHNTFGNDFVYTNISSSSGSAIREFVSRNRRYPDELVNGSLWAASQIESDLFLGGAKPEQTVTGYYVELGLPAAMYKQECPFDWSGKRIGYIDWCDYYLVKSIIKGYRIADASVDVVEVPMANWSKLVDWMYEQRVDAIVAFIVPESSFAKLLYRQQLSVVGWGKLDMDRVRIFHPYVRKVEVDVKELIANKGASSMLVMDREKNGPLLEMTYGLYKIRSNGREQQEPEGFITRLNITPESLDPTYRCYGDLTIEQKALCDSPFDSHGEPKMKPTTWDRPCVKNEDCPFYRANKRYSNTRGGCLRGGICEMPTGILRTAFRTYHAKDVFAPFCYGCKGSDPACCSKQGSPDYAFPNDYDARRQAGVATFVSAV
jgi:hypothetical protein